MKNDNNLFRNQSTIIGILAPIITVLAWFSIPSQTWLGRFWTVGTSVCHQIPSHSFIHSDHQFPLCARCTGLYIGCFIGLIYFAFLGKRKALPARPYRYLLFIFFFAWAGDGLNSFINDFFNQNLLYQTTNLTRLVTGFGMGLAMSTALMTLFNIVIWQNPKNQSLLNHYGQVLAFIGFSAGTGWLLFHPGLLVFKILAVLSIITVLVVISMLYTIFWVIILKKENSFLSIIQLSPFLLTGLATALAQVKLLSLLRNLII